MALEKLKKEIKMSKHNPLDRELSKAEKAAIVGIWRQCQNILMVMGVMELSQDSVENVLENYFGKKLAKC